MTGPADIRARHRQRLAALIAERAATVDALAAQPGGPRRPPTMLAFEPGTQPSAGPGDVLAARLEQQDRALAGAAQLAATEDRRLRTDGPDEHQALLRLMAGGGVDQVTSAADLWLAEQRPPSAKTKRPRTAE